MSTGIYIRVSSPKGQKTDSQRAELEAWLKRHRHKAVQWFDDRDSATNRQRDVFQTVQAARHHQGRAVTGAGTEKAGPNRCRDRQGPRRQGTHGVSLFEPLNWSAARLRARD